MMTGGKHLQIHGRKAQSEITPPVAAVVVVTVGTAITNLYEVVAMSTAGYSLQIER